MIVVGRKKVVVVGKRKVVVVGRKVVAVCSRKHLLYIRAGGWNHLGVCGTLVVGMSSVIENVIENGMYTNVGWRGREYGLDFVGIHCCQLLL